MIFSVIKTYGQAVETYKSQFFASVAHAIPVATVSPLYKASEDLKLKNIFTDFRLGYDLYLSDNLGLGFSLDRMRFVSSPADLTEKINSYNSAVSVGYPIRNYECSINGFSFSGTKIFEENRFLFQPRLKLVFAQWKDGFSVILRDPRNPGMSGGTQGLTVYSTEKSNFFSLVPEFNLKYILIKRSQLNFALSFGVEYLYFRPDVRITESKYSSMFDETPETRTLFVTDSPVSFISCHLGLALLMAKK